jgi:hypothetical protein
MRLLLVGEERHILNDLFDPVCSGPYNQVTSQSFSLMDINKEHSQSPIAEIINGFLSRLTNRVIPEILSLTCSLTSSMFSKMHFPVSHYCCTLSASTQYASMTTKYLPPSNYAINNQHVLMAAFVPLYHPLHIQLEPETPVSTH